MTQAIEREKTILEQIKGLTEQQQQEVLDFIEFLQFKAQKQEVTDEEKQPISFLEAAKEFIGSVEGPSDLSLKKKELKKGYKAICKEES